MHPQPRTQKKRTSVVTTGSPQQSGLPCAMVLTAYTALSSATNSFCHRHQRIKVCLSPVGPTLLRQLSISNGCQDHTALPYASAPFVQRAGCSLTDSKEPALRFPIVRATLPRPPHPAPNVRDDRDMPLSKGTRRLKLVELICPTRQA